MDRLEIIEVDHVHKDKSVCLHSVTSQPWIRIFARSALYLLCVRGPARTLVCCCCCCWCGLDFVKLALSSGRVTTLLPLGVLTEIFKYCVFSLFLDQFDQRLTLHICGLRGPENGHFSLFLGQFDQKFWPRICGLGVPKNGHFWLLEFCGLHVRFAPLLCSRMRDEVLVKWKLHNKNFFRDLGCQSDGRGL